MELNETELSVLAKFYELTGSEFDFGDAYEVSDRRESPTGFMTDLHSKAGFIPTRDTIFEGLPLAITKQNITVGFLVYHDGRIATAIEGYIADGHEVWEHKGHGIEWTLQKYA